MPKLYAQETAPGVNDLVILGDFWLRSTTGVLSVARQVDPVIVWASVIGAKLAPVADVATATPAVAPAGGVGAAAGGWDTAANRDAAITTINSLRTLADENKTQINLVLARLRTLALI